MAKRIQVGEAWAVRLTERATGEVTWAGIYGRRGRLSRTLHHDMAYARIAANRWRRLRPELRARIVHIRFYEVQR